MFTLRLLIIMKNWKLKCPQRTNQDLVILQNILQLLQIRFLAFKSIHDLVNRNEKVWTYMHVACVNIVPPE